MAINFDALPTGKPNTSTPVVEGRHLAVVEKAEMVTPKEGGNQYLKVTFKTKDGGYVSENYFDSDKAFVQYKLSRLLKATKVILEGTGTLEDVAKLVRTKKVIIDVVVNDRGYASLDFTDSKEGVYTREEFETTEEEPELEEAMATEDEDF